MPSIYLRRSHCSTDRRIDDADQPIGSRHSQSQGCPATPALLPDVHGELTPTLAKDIEDLHVIDAAPIQLRAAWRKLTAIGRSAELRRMTAENLRYRDGSFDTALMFLLLHELPAKARRECLTEAIRVLRPGGRFVIAEYGESKRRHFFHRFAPMRWILTKAEPFLGGFWSENLNEVLAQCAEWLGRKLEVDEEVSIFGGFYRVVRYRVT